MSLIDYSEMENEITEAQEPIILPAGREVKVRIVNVKEGISDTNDAHYFSPVFDVPEEPMVIEFNDFFWDLSDKDKIDPKQYERTKYRYKTFFQCFGVDISKPFDMIDDMINREGWVILGVRKDPEYGDKNTIKKYVSR